MTLKITQTAPGMAFEKTFFKKVNENRPTEAFWNECKQLRRNLNTESINALNALMDKED